MRDIVLAAMLAYPILMGLRHPWIGVLGWTWVSIMNPHQLSWALSNLPVAMAMAASTLVGLAATADKRNFFVTPATGVLMAFMAWMCITLPFSFYFDESFELWKRVMKIDFMVLVAMVVLHSRKHIMALAWVLVASLGFFGVKGGIFTIATGGSYRVWGPDLSYISGNNEIALALVMVIPLMQFLQLTATNKWVKRGLLASMVLCAAAALGSQSRGALLALGAMAGLLWWRGNKKLPMALIFITLGILVFALMPDSWTDRMSTIKTYDKDESATGRLNAWWMAFNLAKSNFFGGGFMVSMPSLFLQYAPDPLDLHASHSIYFMVLGEHGFVGLFLYLTLWILIWRDAGRLRKEGQKLTETMWLSHLGAMCQVSLAGYAVGGAFLSLAYYDLPYNVLVMVVLGRRYLDQKAWVQEPAYGQNRPFFKTLLKPSS